MPALEPFDPLRPLVAGTFIRLHAVIYTKGDAVPYSEADHRILKRLYEQRKIAHGDGKPVESRSPNQSMAASSAETRRQAKAKKAEDQLAADLADQPTEEELAAATTMAKANNHDALFKAASGLAGVTKKMTKGEIALALVRAGREPA